MSSQVANKPSESTNKFFDLLGSMSDERVLKVSLVIGGIFLALAAVAICTIGGIALDNPQFAETLSISPAATEGMLIASSVVFLLGLTIGITAICGAAGATF